MRFGGKSLNPVPQPGGTATSSESLRKTMEHSACMRACRGNYTFTKLASIPKLEVFDALGHAGTPASVF